MKFNWSGIAHAGVVHLDAESPTYREGQHVTVIVDRGNPARFTIRGETNQSPVTTWPMIGAFVGSASMLVLAGYSLTRVRRQRRCLVLHPWIRLACIYREIPAGSSVRPLLLLTPTEHQSVVLTLASIARWRLGKTGLRRASEIDVSGDPSGYVVVRAPGFEALVSARPPRTARAERRWRRALETIANPPVPPSR